MVHQNREKLMGKKFYPLCLFFPLVAVLSCASSAATVPGPESFYAGRSDFSLMAPGADLYINADVQSVRPILEVLALGGMTGAEIKDFLDMSDTLTAAVFRAETGRHFYAAASGRFPSVRGGVFLSNSRDWESRQSASGIPYWYSPQPGVSIFFNAKNAYLSDGDPFVPPPGVESPVALAELRKGAVLSGWMENPASAINRIAAAFGVPIEIPAERLVFAVFPLRDRANGTAKQSESYTAVMRLETPSPTQAKALVRIFIMAKAGLALADFSGNRDMEILARAFFSENPVEDGNALILKSSVMSGRDIALLFNTVAVY
jgi:hypothetical protein